LQFRSRHLLRRQDPARCDRRLRDDQIKPEITRVFCENRTVYGADEVWTQLNREGTPVACCTVERLMRELGNSGVTRDASGSGPRSVTRPWSARGTRSTAGFGADRPNRLWVADLTYVKT